MKTGASFQRGKSRTDYETPNDFLSAVHRRFGKPSFDLACHSDGRNAKAPRWFSGDSLKRDWHKHRGLLWLNPPFDYIAPWAEKCALESSKGANILFLVPASVGAEWFARHVWGHSRVLALRPRLTFKGASDPYPKDCILAHFHQSSGLACFELWKWK